MIALLLLHHMSVFLDVGTDAAAAVAEQIHEVVALDIELISDSHSVVSGSEVRTPI